LRMYRKAVTIRSLIVSAGGLVRDGKPMNLFMLALGVLATATGCVMVGFGIPINAFSIGNTLIISGTVAISSGFILVALAMALGQLRRIAEALSARTFSGPGAGRTAESVETMVPPTARITPAAPPSPVPTRIPVPPRSMDMPDAYPPEPHPVVQRPPEPPRPSEPRFPATAASEPPGPLDWLRAKARPGAPALMGPPVAEPPMVEVPDEAPRSPRPPQRPQMPAEPALDPKMWPSPPGRADGLPEPRPMPRATPQSEPPKEPEVPPFDSVWDRSGPAPSEARRDARLDAPPPGAPRREPMERRPEPPKLPSERTPTILKSGVIDGMPYTLYADGSIEAQLPQGTVKFASVDALRAHLEKHG